MFITLLLIKWDVPDTFGAGACRRRSSAADPGNANVKVVGGAGDRFSCVVDGILIRNVGFEGIGGYREG